MNALNRAPAGLLRTAPLYAGFAATGVGVALPGVLLPALLVQWRLTFEQGGRLFLLAWIGSSLGALLVHHALRTTLLLGSLATAAGSLLLAFTSGRSADASIPLYGLGLGLTMTSITLIRRQTSHHIGTDLVRLNLFWAIGACACPSLALRAVTRGNLHPVLCGLALCFACLALWTLFQPRWKSTAATHANPAPWAVFRNVPLGLLLLTTLITGVEASAGGWLATYARRGGHPIADMIAAPTCFWAGLLLSRALWSNSRIRIAHATTVRGSLGLMAIASVLLISGTGGPLILFAAFLLGFGIGPTYPLLLAWAIRFQPGGAIFFLAGVGSACLPWLTGLVSTRQHSLRMGLIVPTATSILLLAIALAGPLAQWSREDPAPPRL
jgi:FHS family glucose/mannose:H+ symporter-like MFS transporter